MAGFAPDTVARVIQELESRFSYLLDVLADDSDEDEWEGLRGPWHEPVKFSPCGNYRGRRSHGPGMETKNTNMDFASNFVDTMGLIDPFLSIEDMLDFTNEDIAGSIGEEKGLRTEEVVSSLDKAKEEYPFDSHRTITNEFLANDPLCVPSEPPFDDWFSGLLDGGISPEGRAGYGGDDIFNMQMRALNESSVTCNQSSITSDQKSFKSSDEHSCRDSFLSSSPVSVLESTSVSSGNARVDGSSCGNHGDHHLQSNHNQFYREQSVPARARSKRSRTNGRLWGNARILSDASSYSSTNPAHATDAEATFSSDSSLISDHIPGAAPVGGAGADSSMQNLSDIMHIMTPPPKAVTTAKKPWKPGKSSSSGSKDGVAAAVASAGGVSSEASNQQQQQPWRCLHCGSQRTPQWRAGPQGPKTLCNACGVRYKSGRLVPEYRPAGSPGFDGNRHSNCHKKIMERRRQTHPVPPSLKTSSKDSISYTLGPGLSTGLEFQSLGPFASPNSFSSSPVRTLDVDRISCS